MSRHEFWNEDVWLVRTYVKKKELENESINHDLWLNGVYTYKALTAALGAAFKDKNTKAPTYLEEPLKLKGTTPEEKQAKENEEAMKTIAYFDRLQNWFDRRDRRARRKEAGDDT